MRKIRVNHEIRLTPVRLIDQNNEQVGVVETRDAMRMAQEAGLDLVEIQADIRPPVCKIMDYGKYKYELSKKEQRGRAASRTAEMKEVRLGRSAKIDEHDVHIRVEQARKFLLEGHKVQFVQQFRGREIAHKEIGFNRMKAIVETLSDIAKVEVPARLFEKRLTMILAPDRAKLESIKRKAEKEKATASGDADQPREEASPEPAEQEREPQPAASAR